MTTLAADLARPTLAGDEIEIPMVASDIIYMGAAVGIEASAGHARPLVAGDRFAGFNLFGRADNSAGAAAAINVTVRTRGVVELPLSGLTQDDVGKAVWATDDNAFTLTNTADACKIGTVLKLSARSGYAYVAFDALQGPIDPVTKITAASVAHALNSTFSDTEVEAALNLLGTAINTIITALEQHGIAESN